MAYKFIAWALRAGKTPQEKLALAVIADAANEKTHRWTLSTAELARRMGYSAESRKSVRKIVCSLEDQGLIKVIRRPNPYIDGLNMVNEYIVYPDLGIEWSHFANREVGSGDPHPGIPEPPPLDFPFQGVGSTDPHLGSGDPHPGIPEPPRVGSGDPTNQEKNQEKNQETDLCYTVDSLESPATIVDNSHDPVSEEFAVSQQRKALNRCVKDLAHNRIITRDARGIYDYEHEGSLIDWMDAALEDCTGIGPFSHYCNSKGWMPPESCSTDSYEAGAWLNKLINYISQKEGIQPQYRNVRLPAYPSKPIAQIFGEAA